MSISDVPWPGPRPLSPTISGGGPGQLEFLAGRAQDLQELFDACRTYDVIVITGWSGVGKTSFVRAGVIPMLARTGWHVAINDPWVDLAQTVGLRHIGVAVSPAEAAERLYRAIVDPQGIGSATTPAEAVATVAAKHKRAIVVLDQYEEILRYFPAIAEELLGLVGRTARDAEVPHVIIARSEYAERLRPVEVRRATTWPLRLANIDDEAVREIVTVPAAEHMRISDAAVDRLVGWWMDARDSLEALRGRTLGAEGLADVGLLHLHALLWSFKRWASNHGLGSQITLDDVEQFGAATMSDAAGRPDSLRLVEGVLAGYVEEQASQLSSPQARSADVRWTNGPNVMLARIAPALMAAGYKQPQSLSSLLPYALGDELTPRGARALSRLMDDRTTSADSDVPVAQIRRAAVAAFVGGPTATGTQPTGMAAGIAAGWTDARVIEEMIVSLEEALRRMSRPDVNVLKEIERPGEPIYELVHDAMGPALNRWASAFVVSDLAEVGVIAQQVGSALHTTLRGTTLAGLSDTERTRWGVAAPDDGRQFLSHMKRPASLIASPEISDITFRACDFAGARFSGVALRDVVFERCDLKSTLFEDCELHGVTFRGDLEDPQAGSMNLLTIRYSHGSSEQDDVRFEDVPDTVGLFVDGLGGGTWTFSRATIRNLVITTCDPPGVPPPSVVFSGGSHISPLSVYGSRPLDPTAIEASTVVRAPRSAD